MTIASILRNKGGEVTTVEAGQSLPEVARTLVRHRIGAVLVRGGDGPPLGIVSERDIVRLFAEDEATVDSLTAADAMTKVFGEERLAGILRRLVQPNARGPRAGLGTSGTRARCPPRRGGPVATDANGRESGLRRC